MSERDRRQVHRYTCPACGSEFYSDKIKSGDLGFSMDEIDRAIRRRKDSKHWDHRWHCQVTSGERWVEGVWCSWVHPDSTCMSTRVDESMVQQGEVVDPSARVLAIDDGAAEVTLAAAAAEFTLAAAAEVTLATAKVMAVAHHRAVVRRQQRRRRQSH